MIQPRDARDEPRRNVMDRLGGGGGGSVFDRLGGGVYDRLGDDGGRRRGLKDRISVCQDVYMYVGYMYIYIYTYTHYAIGLYTYMNMYIDICIYECRETVVSGEVGKGLWWEA